MAGRTRLKWHHVLLARTSISVPQGFHSAPVAGQDLDAST